ncbi:fimbria/pilus outer membrane usher protein [Oleisolibacter albus]|uniref:fimbria/pilus outer membrane usher protein n=1 Tax=Oleisolibacter albus TaxID=2171757 RepID=UPI001EFE5F94|nr:fimbria/pilus outer membrane usher protein [Oleisolibacter albus]
MSRTASDGPERRRRFGLWLTFLLLLVIPVVLAAMPAAADGTAQPDTPARPDLFNKVFGRPSAQKARQLDLPVQVDGREIGLVPARIAGSETLVDVAALVRLLEPLAQPDGLAPLRGVAGADGYGSLHAAPPGGIAVRVDPGELVVVVTIPPALHQRQTLRVADWAGAAHGYQVLPPAALSAYMNMRASLDRVEGGGRQGETGDLSSVFEPALAWNGVVAESEIFYREDGARRWSRGATRLVRDFPDSSVRVQAGDVVTPVVGPQVGQSLGGLSIARNFSLQPYRVVQPAGQRDFILDQSSVVEVLVNGRPTRTFRLEPGPYNLSNFPGVFGTNDVRIRITDSFGREQTIEFPFFFDSQLLADGVHEFAYTAGVPSQVSDDVYHYERQQPAFSGYHRLGLSDRLTVGLGVQADRRQHLLSGEAMLATSFGTFALEPAGSDGHGRAATLRFRDYRTGEDLWENRTVSLQLSWQNADYRSFGSPDTADPTRWDAAARISQPLSEDLTVALGGRWRRFRGGGADAYSTDLTLRQRLGTTGSLDLTLSRQREEDGRRDSGLYLSLRFTFDEGRHTVGATLDTAARQRELDWRYQSLEPVDAWTLGVDATQQAGSGDSVQGLASYTHQRFEASVRHDVVSRALGPGSGTENRTQVNLASALAFADGHGGITRPISNSFAIVVPHARLRDRVVGVDPVNDLYLAESDALGPPIVPNIAPYLVRPLLLDVPDAPASYDLGDDRPAVQPGYRTGTLVPIGTDATASVDGMLLLPDGAAAALYSGQLRPLDRPDTKQIPFFTNRKGRFRVDGVRPGRWELVLTGVEARPLPVTVPPEAEGVIALGTLPLAAP